MDNADYAFGGYPEKTEPMAEFSFSPPPFSNGISSPMSDSSMAPRSNSFVSSMSSGYPQQEMVRAILLTLHSY